jgi:hypothetical protein
MVEVEHLQECTDRRKTDYTIDKMYRLAVGPYSLLFNWYLGSILGVKQPKLETGPSSPPSTRVRMSGVKPLFSLCTSMAWIGKTSRALNFLVHSTTDGCMAKQGT